MTTLIRNNLLAKAIALISSGLLATLAINSAVAAPGDVLSTRNATVTAGANTVVSQSASRAVVEWQSFDIADGESVTFNMGSSDSILNIIQDSKASNISGALSGDGAIYLINNHGIMFGTDATVNVGSLVASSLSISAADFINGNYNFSAHPDNKGNIVNNGVITAATGGTIALIGNSVVNTNEITALFSGKVVMAAGEAMTLSFDGDGLMQFEITQALSMDLEQADNDGNAVLNNGDIIASIVSLKAHTAADVFTNAVNQNGYIRAEKYGIDNGGVIYLEGDSAPVTQSASSQTYADTITIIQTNNTADAAAAAQAAAEAEAKAAAIAAAEAEAKAEAIAAAEAEAEAIAAAEAAAEAAALAAAEAEAEAEATGTEEDPDVDQNTLNASAQEPVSDINLAAITNSSLGLFNVEAPGIKLPADQIEDTL